MSTLGTPDVHFRHTSPRAEGLAEKGTGFGVLILVDNIVIGSHDHPERIAEHRRRRGEVLGRLKILGSPDGTDQMWVEPLSRAHGDGRREFYSQGRLAEWLAAMRQEEQ